MLTRVATPHIGQTTVLSKAGTCPSSWSCLLVMVGKVPLHNVLREQKGRHSSYSAPLAYLIGAIAVTVLFIPAG